MQQNNNRQDEIITNIQENQRALTKGLSDLLEPYQREIIFRDELPKMIEDKGSDEDQIQLGDDEDQIQLEDDEAKPSTSKKKTTILNIDKDIDDEYKTFLHLKKLPLPSKIMEENMNLDELIKKQKIKYPIVKIILKKDQQKRMNPIKI